MGWRQFSLSPSTAADFASRLILNVIIRPAQLLQASRQIVLVFLQKTLPWCLPITAVLIMHFLHNQGINTYSAVILMSAVQWEYL
jgi:hypothetical protein